MTGRVVHHQCRNPVRGSATCCGWRISDRNTDDPSQVTCKRCLTVIARVTAAMLDSNPDYFFYPLANFRLAMTPAEHCRHHGMANYCPLLLGRA